MFKIDGKIVVNTIHGRYGEFNVATLYSSAGDFVVRYKGLDQFSKGTYFGEFVVSCTYQKTRKFGVGLIIEPIAELEDIILDEVDEGNAEELPEVNQDPIEEDLGTLNSKDADILSKSSVEIQSDLELKELFKELWPLGKSVKIDPTVGRPTLRRQSEYLTSQGYVFNPKKQIFVK